MDKNKPSDEELRCFRAEAAILLDLPIRLEAEYLPVVASANCTSSMQDMSPWGKEKWSGGRQCFCYAQKGGSVVLELDLPRKGTYRLHVYFTRAPDFGIVQVSLDGKNLGKPFDGYHPQVAPPDKVELDGVELGEGKHLLRFEVPDKNPSSTNFFMGIDCFILTPEPS